MNQAPESGAIPAPMPSPWLQPIGAFGAVLALLILGASMFLRLATVFGPGDQAMSTLEPAIEQAARLVHRLSASGVAVLALGALVLSWRSRRPAMPLLQATAWVVASTVVLAVIGPLTTGYRIGMVTVANVTCGMVLLMAFWWLRESVAVLAMAPGRVDGFSWAALIAFVLHVATGAAASAWEMRGIRWPGFLHLGSLVLCIVLVGSTWLAARGHPATARWRAALAGLMGAQLLAGYVLMWQESHPFWLSFLHAMLSPLLAFTLVSLVVRGATRPGGA
jgi:heme A synthase